MLKYLSSYTFLSLLEAITRSQSRTLCFFKNFFVKYLRYLHAAQQRLGGLQMMPAGWGTGHPCAPCVFCLKGVCCNHE